MGIWMSDTMNIAKNKLFTLHQKVTIFIVLLVVLLSFDSTVIAETSWPDLTGITASNVDEFDSNGKTLLMNEVHKYYLRNTRNSETLNRMRFLLEKGANPNLLSENHRKNSAFHAALDLEFLTPAIILLLEFGADPNQPDGKGYGSLFRVINRNDIAAIRLLLEANTDPNQIVSSTQYTALMAAIHAKKGKEEIVELLLDFGANPDLTYTNITPLTSAVIAQNPILIKLLVQYGADINEKALLILVSGNKPNISIVKLLIKLGANVNMQKERGNTALHAAIHYRNQEIADLLIKHGALENIKNNMGKTPRDVAR